MCVSEDLLEDREHAACGCDGTKFRMCDLALDIRGLSGAGILNLVDTYYYPDTQPITSTAGSLRADRACAGKKKGFEYPNTGTCLLWVQSTTVACTGTLL